MVVPPSSVVVDSRLCERRVVSMSYRCPAVVPKLVHDIASVMLHSTSHTEALVRALTASHSVLQYLALPDAADIAMLGVSAALAM